MCFCLLLLDTSKLMIVTTPTLIAQTADYAPVSLSHLALRKSVHSVGRFLRFLSFSRRYSCISICGSVRECAGVSADRRGGEHENQQENDKSWLLPRTVEQQKIGHYEEL